jgi:hypothetical protein
MPRRPNPVRQPDVDLFDLEFFVDMEDGDQNDQEFVDRCLQLAKYHRKIKECRVVVLLCGVLHLIASGLLLGIGLRDLNSFLKDATTTLPVSNRIGLTWCPTSVTFLTVLVSPF